MANWIYCIYIDYQNEIGFMIIIEMAKIKLFVGQIKIMLIINMAKLELTGGHIGFIVFIQITKIN